MSFTRCLLLLVLLCTAGSALSTTWVPVRNGGITIFIPIDDPPVANADSVSVNEDVSATIDVLANDSDENLATVAINLTRGSAHGLLTLNPDGRTFNYVPDANFHGSDSFAYSLTDEKNKTSNAVVVSITVVPQNDVPIAANLTASVDEDSALEISPLGSDSDGDTLTPAIATQPANGSVNITNGKFTYQPNPNFNGSDSFTYTVMDASAPSVPATVSITVNPVNDAPVWDAGHAVFGQLTATEDTTVYWDMPNLLPALSDVDGDTLSIVGASTTNGSIKIPDHGLWVEYTPVSHFSGNVQITLYASDNVSTPVAHTFNKNVQFERDTAAIYPEFIGYTAQNAPIIDIHVIEPDGAPALLEFNMHNPSNVLLSSFSINAITESIPSAHRYRYRIVASELVNNGDYTVTATTHDPLGSSVPMDPFTLTFTNGNSPPRAWSGTGNATQGQPEAINAVLNSSVLLENNGRNLALVAGSARLIDASHGTLSQTSTTITYTPAATFVGVATITYGIRDLTSAAESTGTITVTVDELNTPPVANIDNIAMNEDSTVLINVLGNDSDQQDDMAQLVLQSLSNHSHTTVIEDGQVRFTPDANFAGVVSFNYTVLDSGGLTSTGVVNVTVTAMNDKPEISGSPADRVSMNELYTFTPTATDIEGDALSYSILNKPDWASFAPQTGTLSGTPTIASVGQYAGIVISVSDGSESVSLPAFGILVREVNVAPVAPDLTASTREDESVSINLMQGASDANGDPITIVAFSAAAGQVTGNANNPAEVTFTPPENASGNYTITYTLSDQEAQNSGTVTVTVIAVNDAPVIDTTAAMPTSLIEGETFTYQISATDVDSTALTYALVNAPAWLSVDAQGLISGTPTGSDTGSYPNMSFTVTDDAPQPLTTSSQSFTLEVSSGNAAPSLSGTPDTSAVAEQPYSFTPTASDADNDELSFTFQGLPGWMAGDAATGNLSGQPSVSDVGQSSLLEIWVSDGQDSDYMAFTITVDVPAVSVTIDSPAHLDDVLHGPITVSASVSNEVYTKHVEFRINGGAWQADPNGVSPWDFTFTNPQLGSNTFEARVINQSDAIAVSGAVEVTVHLAAPDITISVPDPNDQSTYNVTWTTASGASSYTLQESIEEGPWQTVVTQSDTTASFAEKTPQSYAYRVMATATGAQSAWSFVKKHTVGIELGQCPVE